MTSSMISVEDFTAQARAWVEANLEPDPGSATSLHHVEDDVPPEEVAASRILQRKLFDAGYAGISYPVEYGGRGLTMEHERAFRRAAAGHTLPNFGGAGHVLFTAIGRSLLAHASPDFLHRHIPRMLAGEELWCQFYSEPEAGSDLAGVRTKAVLDGEEWVLTGSKIWSTGAHHADYGMCLARTNWDVPKHRGLTWFAVPTRAPGVEVRPIRQINEATGFCEEFLDGVRVPVSEVIGTVDDGWTVAQTMLVYERGAGESHLPSVPRGLADDLVALARRVGRTADPMVRQAVARASVNDYAQFQLGRQVAAQLAAAERPQPAIAAYGKLAKGTFKPIRARLEVEIAGPAGLAWQRDDAGGDTVAVDYLNGRLVSIAGGTNEVQRNGIGERVLGLPREPSFDSDKPFSAVLRDARNWNYKVT